MSRIEYKNRYLMLLKEFVYCRTDAPEFTDEYMRLWKQDRDESYAKAEEWPERFDLKLQEKFFAGELDGKEFEAQWSVLWAYADDIPFTKMVDQIFTACDCYYEDATQTDEENLVYDEVGLRTFVTRILWENGHITGDATE